MGRRRALVLVANGEQFRFYYEPGHPEILHITLRHGIVPDDAIRTFFEGETSEWDEGRLRFETLTGTHCLF